MNKYELFMEKIEKRKVNLHGFMVIEDGEVTFEHYYKHFDEKSLHRMYSVAKSFVAIAIGFLVDEGRIKLGDKLCDYFPEYKPENDFYPEMKVMTIEDCLSMQSCHSKTTYKMFDDKDWVSTFFKAAPDHKPGCIFSYDTSAALTLGALVEKLTCKELLTYLREKCFDRLGFSKEAYMMKEPGGYSHAGSGLVCTLRDMACVIRFIADKGRIDGKQILSKEYIEKMTGNIVPTMFQSNLDEQNGYGYYFWRTREPGYCMYGMGGQLALVYPEKNLIFVCMSDTQTTDGLSQLYNCFYESIYDMTENVSPADENGANESISDDICCDRKKAIVSKFNNRKIVFSDNAMGIKWMNINFEDCVLEFENKRMQYTIEYGSDEEKCIVFPGTEFKTLSKGYWTSDHTFMIKLYVIEEEFSPVYFEIGFNDENVSVHIKNTSEPEFLRGLSGFAGGK